MSTLRNRFREQVREDVKTVALTQLAEGGPGAISLNAIARALGVSGPGLYRYFASRDALLAALVADAYAELGEAVAGARTLSAFATRYRRWALAEPHRYRLMFAPPLSAGGELDADAVTQAHALMLALVAVDGVPEPAVGRRLDAQLRRWSQARDGEIASARALGAIEVWSTLHGLVTLELDGNFTSMGLDGGDVLSTVIAGLADRPSAIGP